MKRSIFPLFSSSLECAHHYWKQLLQPGSWVIDATCGNGYDTLFLATILSSFDKEFGVIAIDLQETAIDNTRALLQKELPSISSIHFFHQSHESFPLLASENSISLIAYNLGYLPGGDKQKTTLTSSTLTSLSAAEHLIAPGGVISISCYPGHEEGKKEEEALLSHLKQLPQNEWHITHHYSVNRHQSPTLILLQKNTE